MKRALFAMILVVGCAAPSAHRSTPATSPSKPVDKDGVDDAKTITEQPTTKTPSMAPMPGGGSATGTAVMPEDVSKAQITFEDASKAFSAAGGDCAQLCKALHSMTNATDRLCELTLGGTVSDQQRCTDARTRLDAAKTKVKSSCGTCSN